MTLRRHSGLSIDTLERIFYAFLLQSLKVKILKPSHVHLQMVVKHIKKKNTVYLISISKRFTVCSQFAYVQIDILRSFIQQEMLFVKGGNLLPVFARLYPLDLKSFSTIQFRASF